MPGYTIIRFMNTFNPVSIMVMAAFFFTMAVIGWYVITNSSPPQWILALGTAILGAVSFAGGGTLTALHATTVAEQTRATMTEGAQVKNGASTPNTP